MQNQESVEMTSGNGSDSENGNPSGEPHSDDRLFGALALVLLCTALLGAWFFVAFARHEAAAGFGATALCLAMAFGVAGWRHKAGKTAFAAAGFFLALGLVLAMVLLPFRKAGIEQEQAAFERAIQQMRNDEALGERADETR